MLSQQLRDLRNSACGGMRAAAIRFFTPTEAFFAALAPYQNKILIEAGAGTGLLSKELSERGFRMIAIDIMPRDDQWEHLLHLEAESMAYGPDTWLLMCRPDHSGWAYDTMQQALKCGAGVFYAGLERNFDRDLEGYLGLETARFDLVGEEDESLLFYAPT